VPVINFSKLGNERLNETSAQTIFLKNAKVADWLGPTRARLTTNRSSRARGATGGACLDKKAGQIAEAASTTRATGDRGLDGTAGRLGMARGSPVHSGQADNTPLVWLGFCAFFLLGWRLARDLAAQPRFLVCSSRSAFGIQPGTNLLERSLVYPPLLYLFGRLIYVGVREGRSASVAICLQPRPS